MTLKELLKSFNLKYRAKKERMPLIFDIVVYGSLIRGKTEHNDVDIAVILKKKTALSHKLELASEFKEIMPDLNAALDVKVVDIKDLEDPGFLARSAILAEGFSLINKKFLHERFGFKAYVLFKYSLKRLSPSKKKMFYYALQGRRNQTGLLKIKGGHFAGKGMIEVPITSAEEFKDMMQINNVAYTYETILKYR